ncbi:MAG: hypothetical protein U5R06_16380 [candidate division KSB1 bacterium]|nr:hypothetical protein [candidate division KSB1 bacterium]
MLTDVYQIFASWPLSDPSTGGSEQSVITSGAITAFDESFCNMRINGYTGAERSQRSDNRPPGGATSWRVLQTSRIPDVFVEFAVSPMTGTSLTIDHISFEIGGNSSNYLKAEVLYSTDSTFSAFNQIPDELVLEGNDYAYPGYLLRAYATNQAGTAYGHGKGIHNT